MKEGTIVKYVCGRIPRYLKILNVKKCSIEHNAPAWMKIYIDKPELKNRWVPARYLGSSCGHIFLKSTLQDVKISKIVISKYMFERIAAKDVFRIRHPHTPAWMKMYINKPELIQLRNVMTGDTMLFTVDTIGKEPGIHGDVILTLGTGPLI